MTKKIEENILKIFLVSTSSRCFDVVYAQIATTKAMFANNTNGRDDWNWMYLSPKNMSIRYFESIKNMTNNTANTDNSPLICV
jgi:hypothetical protein